MNDRITPHFGLNEMTQTEVRAFVAENRILSGDIRNNLDLLCADVLEEIRELIGLPIIVHSGYRCPGLNAHIGGAKNSEHMAGNACDFHVMGMNTRSGWEYTFDRIRTSAISFGQLILEPGWVHVSRATVKHSHEIIKFDGVNYKRLEV